MTKSLRCKFRILWVHHATRTLPHSVTNRGWCPSSSAKAPRLAVKSRACWKLGNGNTRSSFLMLSSVISSQSETRGWRLFQLFLGDRRGIPAACHTFFAVQISQNYSPVGKVTTFRKPAIPILARTARLVAVIAVSETGAKELANPADVGRLESGERGYPEAKGRGS